MIQFLIPVSVDDLYRRFVYNWYKIYEQDNFST